MYDLKTFDPGWSIGQPQISTRRSLLSFWSRHQTKTIIYPIILVLAHIWVPGAKTTGPIAKRLFFLNQIFMSVRIFKFQCNALGSFTKVHCGACHKWRILFFDIFQRNLAHL
jgi:hypothetical protein